MPIPLRRSASASRRPAAKTSRPRHLTLPRSGRSSPDSTPMKVVLPEPDGPINATKSRDASVSEAPRTANTPFAPRYVRAMSRASSTGSRSGMARLASAPKAELALGELGLEVHASEGGHDVVGQPHPSVRGYRVDQGPLVHQSSVAHPDPAVGPTGGREVVRHHHDRH